MEFPTMREATCNKQLAEFRRRVALASTLSEAEREQLQEELKAFIDSLSVVNNAVIGAGVGLVAAVLPVIGWISGPVIGGLACAYRSNQLAKYRDEAKDLLKSLPT